MEIIVTTHAIEQYQRRSFRDTTDNNAENLLLMIARRGKKQSRRPPYDEQIYKVSYQGHAIVAKYQDKQITVITYLGNKRYQHWYEKNEIRPRALAF